jgi:putative phage-type endonuclease
MKPRCKKLVLKDKAEWLKRRREFITATDIGALIGENVFDTRESLLGDKLFAKAPIVSRRHINRGISAERPIVEAFAAQYGVPFRHPLDFVVSVKWPWLGCTPDALCRIDGETHLLEIKAPEKPWRDGVPKTYEWQLKAQLMVTGIKKGLLVYAQFDEKTQKVSNLRTHEVTLSKFDEKRIETECYRAWQIIRDLRPVIDAVMGRYGLA